jgi:FAD/FMN-containing dehydrogenase
VDLIDKLGQITGPSHVFSEIKGGKYGSDWTGVYQFSPLAVVRPANTSEVSEILKLANREKLSVVPMSGNTGLAGGTYAEGSIVLSLERMNRIREIRNSSRIAVVEAGVVLSSLHAAVDDHDLIFPMTFGARGSAMIGGMLSTNAGGSNVLKYGNTRDLCLGLEVVLPTGEIMDIMCELHKDNSGYNLKHLVIGAEGTLGIITAAVLKLSPKPKAEATAMLATASLDEALHILNRLQSATDGSVQAFEYMPGAYIDAFCAHFPAKKAPFETRYETNIMVDLGSTMGAMFDTDATGKTKLTELLEEVLAEEYEGGAVLDAVVAQNEAQRQEMWERREAAAEVTITRRPIVANDIAVPLDRVSAFVSEMEQRLQTIDPGGKAVSVAHLGDGNIHYTVWPASEDAQVHSNIVEEVEELVLSLGGSFSAEHGIGLSKLPSMTRRKNQVAMQVMRQIKATLDPNNILNPQKVIPSKV